MLDPLGMAGAALEGSPAHGIWATLDDVVRFLTEVQRPALVHETTADDAVSAQWPELAGIVPGVGRFDPCPWGLGFEIEGAKAPHWMGAANSAPTFGHFGGAGTMMWADPVAGCALVALTDRTFDEWSTEALQRWPELSDAVLAEVTGPMTFGLGDRVRWATTGDDGLPLVRYGFVGGVASESGPVMVMLDGELNGDVIDLEQLQPVIDHQRRAAPRRARPDRRPELRRGLVHLWQAEAEQAGLDVDAWSASAPASSCPTRAGRWRRSTAAASTTSCGPCATGRPRAS